ncbi:hypothetical protein ACFLR3_00800 [Campylobacterota bacterium]
MKILDLYEQIGIDLNTTMSLSTNNGGVVTVQLYDALLFIEEINLRQELSFLEHLALSKDKPTEQSIVSFFKHLFFDGSLAKQFVQWQRSHKVA